MNFCIPSPGNLPPRLLVILFPRNCLYNISLVILYTITILITVLTTCLVYKTSRYYIVFSLEIGWKLANNFSYSLAKTFTKILFLLIPNSPKLWLYNIYLETKVIIKSHIANFMNKLPDLICILDTYPNSWISTSIFWISFHTWSNLFLLWLITDICLKWVLFSLFCLLSSASLHLNRYIIILSILYSNYSSWKWVLFSYEFYILYSHLNNFVHFYFLILDSFNYFCEYC